MIIFILQLVLCVHGTYSGLVTQENASQNKTASAKQDIENRSDVHQTAYNYDYGVLKNGTENIHHSKEIQANGQHTKDPDEFIDKDKGSTITRRNGYDESVPPYYKMAHRTRWRTPPIRKNYLSNNYMMQGYNFGKEQYMKNANPFNTRQNMILDPIFKPLNMVGHSHQNTLIQPLKPTQHYQYDNSLMEPFKSIEEHFDKNLVTKPFKFIQDPHQDDQFKLFPKPNQNNQIQQSIQLSDNYNQNNQMQQTLKLSDSYNQNNQIQQPLKLGENYNQNNYQPIKFNEDHQDDPIKIFNENKPDGSIIFPLKLPQNNSLKKHQLTQSTNFIEDPLLQPIKMVEHHLVNDHVFEHRYPKKRTKKFRRKIKKRPVVYYDNNDQHLTNHIPTPFDEPMKKLVKRKPPKGIYMHHMPDPNNHLNDKYILPDSSSSSSEPGFFEALSSALLGDFSNEEKPVIVHRVRKRRKPSSYYNSIDEYPRKVSKRRNKYKVRNMNDQFAFY